MSENIHKQNEMKNGQQNMDTSDGAFYVSWDPG
jgi:hypothetical protein